MPSTNKASAQQITANPSSEVAEVSTEPDPVLPKTPFSRECKIEDLRWARLVALAEAFGSGRDEAIRRAESVLAEFQPLRPPSDPSQLAQLLLKKNVAEDVTVLLGARILGILQARDRDEFPQLQFVFLLVNDNKINQAFFWDEVDELSRLHSEEA